MRTFRHLAILWLLASLSLWVHAGPTIESLVPNLLPIATKAREGVVNHRTLAAFEVENTIRDALNKAGNSFKTSRNPIVARRHLESLEKTIGPLRENPLIELHLFLATLAEADGNPDDKIYHQAFANALFLALSYTGDGTSPATAFRIVMNSEENAWFKIMKHWLSKSRTSKEIDGKTFDIWKARAPSGVDRDVYFDTSAMQASLRRILKERSSAQ